jgi:hypothetical protein
MDNTFTLCPSIFSFFISVICKHSYPSLRYDSDTGIQLTGVAVILQSIRCFGRPPATNTDIEQQLPSEKQSLFESQSILEEPPVSQQITPDADTGLLSIMLICIATIAVTAVVCNIEMLTLWKSIEDAIVEAAEYSVTEGLIIWWSMVKRMGEGVSDAAYPENDVIYPNEYPATYSAFIQGEKLKSTVCISLSANFENYYSTSGGSHSTRTQQQIPS